MDIDMQALRLLERERDISLDVLVSAIEQALLSAYHRTPGAYPRARVEVDRRTGHVTVWAREPLPAAEVEPVEGEEAVPPPVELGPEFDHTPAGFGRIATSTARQVIVQRLRDAEDDAVLGTFRGKEGEVLGGVGKMRLGFSPDFGFTGIAVALLASSHPLLILVTAFLFGALHKGAADLDIETEFVTRDLSLVIQALVIFGVSIAVSIRKGKK